MPKHLLAALLIGISLACAVPPQDEKIYSTASSFRHRSDLAGR